jgi:hypothetical protein
VAVYWEDSTVATDAGVAFRQPGSRETLDVHWAKKQSERSWSSSECFVHLSVERDRVGEASMVGHSESKQGFGAKVQDYGLD